MNYIVVFIISLLLFFALDLYTYQSVKSSFSNRWIRWAYILICLGGYVYMTASMLSFDTANEPRKVINGFMTWIVVWYGPKFLIVAFLLMEDIVRLAIAAYRRIFDPSRKELNERFVPGRRRFIHNTALGLAAVSMAGIVHGVWKGKYNFRVIKKTLYFDDLPPAFDGFTITQVSDIHSGSFDNEEKIRYAIDLIKEQNSDLFLFTGDMVNNLTEEIYPWVDMFAEIRAPYGQFAVLGNHDYAEYTTLPDEEREWNVSELVRIQNEEIGYRNLRNEAVKITKDGESIDLVGVENWGVRFKQYGDLDLATKDLEDDSFKILMSHDPTHFDYVVKDHKKKVNLTLSGHTHGMQMGIEIPGIIKWSPAGWVYPKWAGLYKENNRYLYVNRGFGFLAFPGRIGMWPEITVLELKRKSNV